jgi:uncharacterized protein YjbJ (UPF0337 family)
MANKNIDKAKGRAKEAAGAVSGNKRLKNEGRADQAKGSAKNAVNKVADTLTGRKHWAAVAMREPTQLGVGR